MSQEANRSVIAEIEEVLRTRYPGLTARLTESGVTIEGMLQLRRDGMPFESFLLEIQLAQDPNSRQPKVFEIGGRIPRLSVNHINKDGSLCVGVAEEVWLLLRGRFEIGRFIDEVLEPYLLGVACKLRGEEWPFGERSHGAPGICEFYGEHFGTKEPTRVLEIIEVLLADAPKGHWRCPCGSGQVIRKCHRQQLLEFRERKIPTQMLIGSAIHIANLIEQEGADRQKEELRRIAERMQRMLSKKVAA